jgi:hypothetical protein
MRPQGPEARRRPWVVPRPQLEDPGARSFRLQPRSAARSIEHALHELMAPSAPFAAALAIAIASCGGGGSSEARGGQASSAASVVVNVHDPPPAAAGSSVFFTIRGITLAPEANGRLVHLHGKVNDTEFDYPSVAGAWWAQVGPSMSLRTIQVPLRDDGFYYVSFSLDMKREGDAGAAAHAESDTANDGLLRIDAPVQASSQQAVPIHSLPFSGDYALYVIDPASQLRFANVIATVHYSMSAQP